MSVSYNDEGLKVYSCQICGKVFKKSSHVKTHIENVHTADGKVKCGICTKTFKNKESLKTHFRIIHGLAKCQIYQTNIFDSYMPWSKVLVASCGQSLNF